MFLPRSINPGPQPSFRILPGGPAASYCGSGQLTSAYGVASTVTRSGSRWCFDGSGNLVSISANTAAVEPRGLLVESARTNLVLHNRDLTQSAWTKSNTTAAKTATGIDGVANSASTLTATATNGTVLQAVTVASAARTTSLYLKRRTGTGTVEITRNNGTNWTAVTSSINATTWTRVTLTSTLANPTVGIRLGTNGDAVDVDCAQDEAGSFATSPIVTGAATVARNADSVSMSATKLPFAACSVSLLFTPLWSTSTPNELIETRVSNGVGFASYIDTDNKLYLVTKNTAAATTQTGSTNALTWTPGQTYAIRLVYGSGNHYLYRDGVLVGSNTAGTAIMPDNAPATLRIGQAFTDGFQADGYLSDIVFAVPPRVP